LISKLIEDYDEAKENAMQEKIHDKISQLLNDDIPEVRAAAIYALKTFIGDDYKTEERFIQEMKIGSIISTMISDGSHIVRKELVFALSIFIQAYKDNISVELLKNLFSEDEKYNKHRSSSLTKV
jgi:regulatory associated protein of mTOR